MLQVQEDGVISLQVPQQLGHVGDAVWDDGQPLRLYVAWTGPEEGRPEQISWGPARGHTLLFRDNQMSVGAPSEEQLPPLVPVLTTQPLSTMEGRPSPPCLGQG